MHRRPHRMLSKSQLLKWMQQTLNVSSGYRIELLGTGVIYCQLVRHFHPQVVSEAAVLKDPKNEYECMSNLKLLQMALVKLKTSKQIDIAKLAKCRYQDNWELLSWLHDFLTSPEELAEEAPPAKFAVGKRTHHAFVQQKENFLYNRCLAMGKSSVSSELFRNDYSVVVERAKDILVKLIDDTEKVRQLKLLLNVPLTEPANDDLIEGGELGLDKLFDF